MSNVLRRMEIPILITAFCTLLQVIPYYLNIPVIDSASATMREWMLLVVNMAVFVGVISLGQVHGKRIQRRGENWPFSVVLMVFMVLMAIVGFPLESLGLGFKNAQYLFMFNNILNPLGGTMYSILAFFITSAAYRAFRARNWEAAFVLVSGTIVVMSNAPLFTSSLPFLITWKDWIFDVPNTATGRGVMIGAALGAIALAVRVLMGIERGYLRGGGEE
ncbi:hypothetical protein ISS40_04720 [Candidatus Bathyarchaeota archaeon]|nr:hypothetical protein [Candidatus Bathyarchaeota archaeon]MBL7167955.1 hypothetical protein [Candidatus Bathyarchaeota archaeon]